MSIYSDYPKTAWGATGVAALGIVLALVFRTEATRANFSAWVNDEAARVTCASGGNVIFDAFSTGKVINETNSDGYTFVEQSTGVRKQASGDCIISYGEKPQEGFVPLLTPER